MFLDQNRAPLLDALIAHHAEGVHPFHVPGHKHGVGARDLLSLFGQTTLSFDLNAMHDLDDACNPVGVIDEAQRLAAHLFGADHAHFLVNGNTQGIHSMMLSAVGPGEQIVLPRNCHRSAITGLILSGGLPIYVPVEIDAHLGVATGPTVQSVRATLEKNPFVCALFVVNPSYYGFATDIEGMVRAAHDHRAAALVDEAHGTHLSFHPDFPANAMSVGADMSAVSMHKTGGSLTQSAILLSKGERVPHDILKESIDLILMDVNMPKMDGIECTRQIRILEQNGRLKRTPIIIVTASIAQEDTRLCYEAGIDDLLFKPFKSAELIEKMKPFLPTNLPIKPNDQIH